MGDSTDGQRVSERQRAPHFSLFLGVEPLALSCEIDEMTTGRECFFASIRHGFCVDWHI